MLPRSILLLEVSGIILLTIIYLNIKGYIALPEVLSTTPITVALILLSVGLMIPAAVFLLRRTLGKVNLLLNKQSDNKSHHGDKHRSRRDQ